MFAYVPVLFKTVLGKSRKEDSPKQCLLQQNIIDIILIFLTVIEKNLLMLNRAINGLTANIS